jgi:argininosuccinate lyase
MRAAIEPAMYSTDIAMELAIGGTPFRDAYRQAAAEITKMKAQQNSINLKRTPEQSLAARISPGAAGNPQNELIQAELDELKGIKK